MFDGSLSTDAGSSQILVFCIPCTAGNHPVFFLHPQISKKVAIKQFIAVWNSTLYAGVYDTFMIN
jgi:hypothetical protein